VNQIGTLIQIDRIFNQEQVNLAVVGKGRQRFLLKKILAPIAAFAREGGVMAEIQILPDYHAVPSPIRCKALEYPINWPSSHSDISSGIATTSFRKTYPRRRRVRPRVVTYWDEYVYGMFDGEKLVRRAQKLLKTSSEWNHFVGYSSENTEAALTVPGDINQRYLDPKVLQDPTIFSFWLASNLPLNHTSRLELLEVNCTVKRLRQEIAILERHATHVKCNACNARLAMTSNIFCKTEAVSKIVV